MVDELLNHARDGWIKMNEMVRGMFGPGVTIDEMALLFPEESSLSAWVKRVVARDGYELFNVAQDTVETGPIPSKYDVEYWFLRTPFDYRLELMRLAGGYSPVHSAIDIAPEVISRGVVIPIHASFKVPDLMAYASANRTLLQEDWECAQKCDSSYGVFSYWAQEQHEGWFLKPRVNLRDGDGSA